MSELRRIARELKQRLELDRLAGWDVPVRASALHAPGARTAPPPPPTEASRTGAAPAATTRTDASPADRIRTEAPRLRFTEERGRKELLLAPLREAVASCTKCSLCHARTQTVFGVGDPTTRLMFIGEAPGFDEDRQGEPFVGRAGQLLNDIIKAMGLRREEIYIANVVKCRPPNNRVPNPAETGSCLEYLEEQIRIVSPAAIVALGGVAAKALLDTDLPLGRLRGRFHEHRGIPLMPTYHPAYLLRYPTEKRKTWEDIQLVMVELGLKRP